MSKEQDDRIIGTMHASLRCYTEHGYPVEMRDDEDGNGNTVRLYVITSPLTGTLYVSRLSDRKGNCLYRMDHEAMMTPSDLVRNYQDDFADMYRLAMAYYLTQSTASAMVN